MITEREIKFIESIDCNFPYHNKQKCLKLIDIALTLSPDAMFFVIQEICRVPASMKSKISSESLFELLEVIKTKFEHQLKELVIEVACKLINGEELTVDDAISKMEIIKKYPRQYAAFSILYFSCDDKDEKLEPIMDSIRNEWNK
ncbi:MAG: hypothetical protein JST20_02770 [Bacteroidetes bacterium]|nr:hypothetical protein [Bacteroidota bacterium]